MIKLKVFYECKLLVVVAVGPQRGTDLPKVTEQVGGGARNSSRAFPPEGWGFVSVYFRGVWSAENEAGRTASAPGMLSAERTND